MMQATAQHQRRRESTGIMLSLTSHSSARAAHGIYVNQDRRHLISGSLDGIHLSSDRANDREMAIFRASL